MTLEKTNQQCGNAPDSKDTKNYADSDRGGQRKIYKSCDTKRRRARTNGNYRKDSRQEINRKG